MSRWKAGATTFGPVGRIAITLLVLLFAPCSMNGFAIFVLWPPYVVLATLVLRATWKRDHVQSMTVAEMAVAGRPSLAPPETPMRVPGRRWSRGSCWWPSGSASRSPGPQADRPFTR
jgi:hypothetical protein